MNFWERKTSIQRQLTNVVVLTSFVALAIACGAFQLYERASFRRSLVEQATALADTAGASSTESLVLDDRDMAKDILGGLRAEPHVLRACIYDKNGHAFAEYRRDSGNRASCPLRTDDGVEFTVEELRLQRPVVFLGEKVGEIVILYDLGALHAKMQQYTGISAVVLLFSGLITLMVSAWRLRPITQPILELSSLAARVAAEEDYSLRAKVHAEDEVGKLVRAFNQMLSRVQQRDVALQVAKDELEIRVGARTEELQLSLKELEDLKFAMDQHCIVARTDARGVITFVNEKFCAVSKYSVGELLGQTHAIVNSRHHPKEFFAELWKTIQSGKTWHGEVKNLAKDGSVYWVDTTIVPFCDESGRPVQFIAIRKEITELKRIEDELRRAKDAAEQASQTKSEFLANMSHEIRTPLNGIMGMTELALDTALTPEQREYLETVKNSSDSLLTVINDILDFSKVEAGKLDLEHADFSLREAVENTLKALAVRADEKQLELTCEIADDVPEIVRGDAARLRQVLTNLTGNAIKFTDHGEVGVRVALVNATDCELTLQFTVWDTGVGILPSKLKMIFDPFSQADSSTTRKYGGTGLGLTISARLVALMGGKIWVESEVGDGSQFHFTVRVERAEKQTMTAGTPANLRGLRVLVVDDSATNRKILEVMLQRWEMKATCAASGEEALGKLAQSKELGEPYGLILTDMHMPKMDGFELVERIRATPGDRAATILMLTSGGRRGDIERCRQLGVSTYLLKPVRQSELREAIARAMGAREEGQVAAAERLSTQETAPDAGEPLRVLVAEDNAVNQRLIQRLLEKRGHRVTLANNGREAANLAEQENFDLIFMDVQMPEMDGFEATETIRAREKRGSPRTPVVALTAHAMKGDREKCIAHGMDDYLTKPIQPAELDAVLEHWSARVVTDEA